MCQAFVMILSQSSVVLIRIVVVFNYFATKKKPNRLTPLIRLDSLRLSRCENQATFADGGALYLQQEPLDATATPLLSTNSRGFGVLQWC